MFQRFSHPMLYVQDVTRAAAWYRDTLGFTVQYEAPGHFASLYHEGMDCRLDLHGLGGRSLQPGDGPIPYFAVADIERAAAALKAAGVRVGEIRAEGDSPRFAPFYDSEGNELGIEEQPE